MKKGTEVLWSNPNTFTGITLSDEEGGYVMVAVNRAPQPSNGPANQPDVRNIILIAVADLWVKGAK